MTFYTIYDHPKDYPRHFVVREWTLPLGVDQKPVAGNPMLFATLEAARHWVPRGMASMPRSLGDDPKIIETWL